MWNRKELKEQGKAALKRNYWKSVLAAAVFSALIGGGACGAGYSLSNADTEITNAVNQMSDGTLLFIGALVVLVIAVAIALMILTNALIVNPLTVGINTFKLNAVRDKGNISDLGHGFDCAYKRNAWTMFLMDVKILLWLCVFIVPGLIKCYEYRMVTYILAENPDMTQKEVFAASRAMMKGNKWRAFVLDISFILWYLLGAITLGIVSMFYVEPYKHLTDAALYEAIKPQKD
ncbi:MAG: DUF975 family protein [Candidatus Ornithomonoglobus sp.]